MSSNFRITFSAKIWNYVLYPLIKNFKIFEFLANHYSYCRRRRKVPPVHRLFLTNKEKFEDFNIDPSWFSSIKKKGISGVARLKNSADFLELCVESFLPYLDEIILAAESSEDGTNEICERLQKKYPDKVKYFFYPYKVRFRDYDGPDQPTTDSVHSFAYFTNWAFSKTSYKYVMRLDDDILPIPDIWEEMRNYVLGNEPNEYVVYSGINVLAEGNRVGVMKSLPLCWTGGDNGIYPVSEHTYFTQIPGSVEAFHFRLKYRRMGFAYLHLKNLKKGFWTAAYGNSDGWKWYQSFVAKSEIDEFHKYTKYPVSKIYEALSSIIKF